LTFGNIFAKPKDHIKTNQKTHAVYFKPFGDCEKEYFGQSKRQFRKRLKEHQKVFFCFNFRQGKISFSRTYMLHKTRDYVGKL
jgi:hypothetical protein